MTNYLEKRGYFSNPPKKSCNNFLGCTGPLFGPTNTNHAKNYQKITFGVLFRIPPQNALQCSAMYCRVGKSRNFSDSKIFHAKTFWIKRVNCDNFDFATKVRKTREFDVFLANVHKTRLDGVRFIQ